MRANGQSLRDAVAPPDDWCIATVTGDVRSDDIEMVLSHEHVCVEARDPQHPQYLDIDWIKAATLASGKLARLASSGVSLVVDWTAIGMGRNVLFLRDVARRSGMPIACATGIGNGAIPPSLTYASIDNLAEQFISELTAGIDHTSIKATFIKVTSLDGGPTSAERRVLAAAGAAASATGVALGIHALDASAIRGALKLVERDLLDPRQIIWGHAEFATHAERVDVAARGISLQFDGMSVARPEPYALDQPEETILSQLNELLEDGYERQILVSNDASLVRVPDDRYSGDPGLLRSEFLPRLEARFGRSVVDLIMRENPIRIFGHRVSPRSRKRLPHEVL